MGYAGRSCRRYREMISTWCVRLRWFARLRTERHTPSAPSAVNMRNWTRTGARCRPGASAPRSRPVMGDVSRVWVDAGTVSAGVSSLSMVAGPHDRCLTAMLMAQGCRRLVNTRWPQDCTRGGLRVSVGRLLPRRSAPSIADGVDPALDDEGVGLTDDVGVLPVVLEARQEVAHGVDPGALLVVALDRRPRRPLGVGARDHRLLGGGVVVPLVQRLQVDGGELPLPDRVDLADDEAGALLGLG